jgi:LAS superfamily LD-carboxypeptidase LdcB
MEKNNLNEASNGLLNASYLKSIGGNHKLNSEAAVAYLKMVAAAKAAGVEWGITDSYRTLEAQKDVAKRKGLYSQGGLAAQPGKSNHGWGSAVDLNFKNGAKGNPLEWLKKNAATYGFTNIPREPWHWEHKQSAKNQGANSSNTSTQETPQDLNAVNTSNTKDEFFKNMLIQGLGLNQISKSFAGIQEEIKRMKNLMK